jgi:DsbC/DsbD-like thiol-disulfide interchange protein/cytochrome c biogenesis protein CcdA
VKFLALLASFLLACATQAAPVKTEHVEAELVAYGKPEAGKPFTIALRLKSIPHWHTYWRNPGDSGQPTTIEWKLPPGWEAGPIQWPAPTRLPIGPLLNFGYENEVLLLVDFRVPKDADMDVQRDAVAANAAWLVCNESRCVPEDALLKLSVDDKWKGPIERTREALPVKADTLGTWKVSASGRAEHVTLSFTPPAAFQVGKLAYFPFDEGKIHNPGAQALARDGDSYLLELPRSKQPVGAFTRIAGLLVSDKHPRAVEIEAPVVGGAAGSAAPGLLAALLFAFIGGLILNLMPCVLPVLSIKILGFAQPGARGSLRSHGALYAAGVVASFLAFAGALIAFKGIGSEIGWGFQLQSPWFVGGLAILFLVLALNLSGVFEFGSVLPAGLANAQLRHPGADAFLTGVLAVAVASPCTAPFMGAALGYALSESATAALAVFAALGLGMALPYVILSWNPAWLRWLPRPGRWMLRFKQALAVPLYATVIWLGWVLALQTGVLDAQARSASAWEPYSVQRLETLTGAGKPVFVDFTAAWCVTCQVNKQLVLSKDETYEAFRSHGVSLLRADWTRRDPEITRALAALGRNGIPVYAFYPPGREPQLLPEILTRDALMGALESLKRKEPSS